MVHSADLLEFNGFAGFDDLAGGTRLALLRNLIPRERTLLPRLSCDGRGARARCLKLEEMLAPDQPVWDKADEIKEVEHKCDFLTHEIIQRLNRTFVTPLDREDIHALARSLDDVMDAIDASATVIRCTGSTPYGSGRASSPSDHRVGQQLRLALVASSSTKG
jgi:hypothetical protein